MEAFTTRFWGASTLVLAGIAACSGGSSGPAGVPPNGGSDDTDAAPEAVETGPGGSDTGPSTMHDGAPGGPSPEAGAGPACPSQRCGGGEVCCYAPVDGGPSVQCMSQCPNGEPPILCGIPSDCPSATPICCGTAVLTGGTVPNCTAGTVSTQCVAKCSENIVLSCTGTDTTRMCASSADCAADPGGNTECCYFPLSPQPFCVSTVIAPIATSCTK